MIPKWASGSNHALLSPSQSSYILTKRTLSCLSRIQSVNEFFELLEVIGLLEFITGCSIPVDDAQIDAINSFVEHLRDRDVPSQRTLNLPTPPNCPSPGIMVKPYYIDCRS